MDRRTTLLLLGAAIALRGVEGAAFWPARRASAKDDLRISISPRIAPAPASVLIQVSHEPADHDRVLEIAVDSGAHYRGSRIALSGAQSSRVHNIELRSLPTGTYQVRVAVLSDTGAVRIFRIEELTVF